ncbi:hypothetical protein SYJ56_19320 [Algoriphagus sp. D3-2-R+10]|uniref:hypothetical protein n=1 Tax=Algoriphagus aurantiacus TaxID=3103948 RepID=UPI002B3AADBD|nr:hypothetical protein [Algoriphagus sp. D3-2-R+10]MEB2777474.1 hypothetical protein [Algoriphagus sp. D3-2-R+10]
MIKIYFIISAFTLFCFYHLPPAMSQDILKKTAKDLCVCIEETSKSDTLDLPPKQIFDKCTGASMANNRVALAKKYDMGTVSGIKALRDELVNELKQDCEQFITMFSENPPKKLLANGIL